MSFISRRLLSKYVANQLSNGISSRLLAKQIAAVLVDSRRQNQSELVVNDIAWQLERSGKLASVQVTSATSINANELKKIGDFIKKAIKVDEAVFNQNLDKSVIGGLRIETADYSWDKTVKRKLSDIKEVTRA